MAKILKSYKNLVLAPLADSFYDDFQRDVIELTDALISFGLYYDRIVHPAAPMTRQAMRCVFEDWDPESTPFKANAYDVVDGAGLFSFDKPFKLVLHAGSPTELRWNVAAVLITKSEQVAFVATSDTNEYVRVFFGRTDHVLDIAYLKVLFGHSDKLSDIQADIDSSSGVSIYAASVPLLSLISTQDSSS